MQLYHIILNNLRRRKAKMMFVLLGLVIGIATIVSVYGVVETMKTEMTKKITEFGVNVVINPDSGGLAFSYGGITLPEIMYDVNELTTEDLEEIGRLPSKDMIRIIAPKLLGTKMLDNGQKITVVGAHVKEEFTVKPWLRIGELNLMSQTEEAQNKFIDKEVQSKQESKQESNKEQNNAVQVNEIVESKTLDNSGDKKMDYEAIDLAREDLVALSLSDNEAIIGSVLAKNLGVNQGDSLTIDGKAFNIYAVLLESGTVQDQQMMMNLGAAQSLLGRSDQITVIEMAVDYMVGSEDALLAEIDEALPHTYVTSLRQETLRADEMLMRLVRFGTTISLLILLVGMLVVALTMSSTVRERTREIGVFRALGFRKKHITQMIIMEGTIISILGGVIGYVVGMLIARYGGPLFTGAQMQVPWRLDLLLISIGISVIIGLLSSLYPAYQATKLDPVEALRYI